MIVIPQQLDELLRGSELAGPVLTFLRHVSPIFDDNDLVFFPYFTSHGPDHVTAVLHTQVQLVPSQIWERNLLGAPDAAVIICATLLHDMAMHLREVGFLQLIGGQTTHKSAVCDSLGDSTFGDKPWQETWEEFLFEAKHFDEEALVRIIGEERGNEPWIHGLPALEKWNRIDYLFIGEFLRRHHARLAHEIALYGFPGLADDESLAQCLGNRDFADLIGLVARSHGVPIRRLQDQLGLRYRGTYQPLGSFALYDAALLRIADFLQIDSSRAPLVLLRLKAPQIAMSSDEWNKHAAVRDVTFAASDPNAIHITVSDEHSIHTHLQLTALINELRKELDSAAAVLSEVYGSRQERLQLSRTRVTDNLNTIDPLLPYEPIDAGVDADPHLLNLLVSPLYGDSPEYGIRELIQNSVDAVREREHFCRSHPELRAEVPECDADVILEIREGENDTWQLSVTDFGIGMTVSTIRDYFLRAGASIRNSFGWRREFLDAANSPAVLRAGRFGIGVYAAFLLGDELLVETKYVTERRGHTFKARKGFRFVEIRRDCQINSGTRVSINLSQSCVKQLELSGMRASIEKDIQRAGCTWDWYVFDTPHVKRQIRFRDGRLVSLRQAHQILNSAGSPAWRQITVKDFDTVRWTTDTVPSLICNGITIKAVPRRLRPRMRNRNIEGNRYKWMDGKSASPFATPSLAVWDAAAVLPLTLRRDALWSRHVPFDSELLDDVVLDFIAFALLTAPTTPMWNANQHRRTYLGIDNRYPLIPKFRSLVRRLSWFCNEVGAGPYDRWLSSYASRTSAIVVGEIGVHQPTFLPVFDVGSAVAHCAFISFQDLSTHAGQRRFDYSRGLRWLDNVAYGSKALRGYEPTKGMRLVVATRNNPRWIEDYRSHKYGNQSKFLACRDGATMWAIEVEGAELPALDLFGALQSYHWSDNGATTAVPFILQFAATRRTDVEPESRFARLWEKYVGPRLIPYNTSERDLLYAQVFSTCPRIREHFDAWQRYFAIESS